MLDEKTKALIIKYLRKAWMYSPTKKQALKRAETGRLNEEGEKIYVCNNGKMAHEVTKVYCDHISPMVPLTGIESWDTLIERLFDINNVQVLCKREHSTKTKAENKLRKRGRK